MGDHSNFFESLLFAAWGDNRQAAGRWAGTVGQHATIQTPGRRLPGRYRTVELRVPVQQG
jgi:hypothetical protein